LEARTPATTSPRISRRASSALSEGVMTPGVRLPPFSALLGSWPLRISWMRSASRTSPSLMAV
jgi:hypothetical protein